MCNIWKKRPKNELGLNDWKMILKDSIFKSIRSLGITGGEAVLHPQFKAITRLFVKSMPNLKKISLVSNGLATDRVVKMVIYLAKLCEKKNIAFGVSISLDGIGKVHDKVRRVSGAFERVKSTLNELKILKNNGRLDWLSCGVLLLRENIDKIGQLEHWLKKKKIDYDFQIVGFHEEYVNNLNIQSKVDFDKTTKKFLFKKLKKLSQPKSWKDVKAYFWADMLSMYKNKTQRITQCPFLKDEFCIDSLGDVYYCFSEKPIGNLRGKKTVGELYYDKKNFNFRKKLFKTACLKCNSSCDVRDILQKDFIYHLWTRLFFKRKF